MLHRKILAFVIGVSQILLGFALLFIPDLFFSTLGFSSATSDQKYLYGQLAARFLAFGIGMFVIARDPFRHHVWWDLMLLIQLIDLAVGGWGVWGSGVKFSVAAFPMANALIFSLLLLLWRPNAAKS